MEKQMEHHEKVKALEEASTMLGDELGGWWGKLADLNRRCSDYFCSDEFWEAYQAEVSREYERLKSEFRIVEAEMPRRTYKKLVHVDNE